MAVVHEVLHRGIDIVVAAKRTGPYSDDRKLGSVARKLLRKCPCAVWLEDWRRSDDPSVIIAATDLSGVGDRVVELATSVAQALDARLHVVHAFSLTMEAQLEGGEARQQYVRRIRELAVKHIERILTAKQMSHNAELHVGLGCPTQLLLEGVEKLEPDLVVMGTVSRGGIAGLLMGNTAERLVDRIDCPLLTVKPDDFVCPVSPDPDN